MRSEREAFQACHRFCAANKDASLADAYNESISRYPDIPLPIVRDIVLDYLKREGFDGLYNGRCQCWCDIEAITSCSCIELECRPGVLVAGKIVPKEALDEHGDGVDW